MYTYDTGIAVHIRSKMAMSLVREEEREQDKDK